MKRTILFFLVQVFCFTAGFAQNPPWKEGGISIPARANLDVRWEATNEFPRKVWTYQLLPNDFSPEIISNIMILCSFTEKDKVQQDTNGVTFKSPDGSRTLSISFPSGGIRYDTPEPHYVLKPDFFKGVPPMEEMPELTKNILQTMGIELSEIQKKTNGIPYFYFSERGYEYFPNHTVVTNTWARTVVFRRSVDGMVVVGTICELYFGEHGKISKLSITWPRLQRIKSYRTVSKKDVINFLREGKADRGPAPDNAPYIDWPSIKSVTITEAMPSYLIDGTRLYPYLTLDATIDTGRGTAVVAILCPIIDEMML
jgi:hypothetical protein